MDRTMDRTKQGVRKARRPNSLSKRRLDIGDTLDLTKRWSLHFDIEHLHGPGEIKRGPEELLVVCLVRDGRPFIKSFVEHYSGLGAKHIVFLDNGSTDGTVEALKDYDNVTVLRSGLPFVEYQFVMKRYLIERFGRDRWTLCVDVDELFDYPYSDTVSLDSFLGYLSSHRYTAVVSQMLDMFPQAPLSSGSSHECSDEPLKEKHRFYDVSNVARQEYTPLPFGGTSNNVRSNPEIEILRGGIKKTIFGYPSMLTKHPLIFHDSKVKPFDDSSHWASGAYIADLTCVLFHYTFLESLYKRLRRDIREDNYFNEGKLQKISRVLEETTELRIKRKTSKEFDSVNDLVDEGFLTISESYMEWVDRNEEESPAPETLRQRPLRLAEAFSRARERRKTQAQAVRQAELRVEELENKVREVRRKAQRIEQQNAHLESGLQEVRNSRAWRILYKVARIRNRLLDKSAYRSDSG